MESNPAVTTNKEPDLLPQLNDDKTEEKTDGPPAMDGATAAVLIMQMYLCERSGRDGAELGNHSRS